MCARVVYLLVLLAFVVFHIYFCFNACKVNDGSVIRIYALKTVSILRSIKPFIFHHECFSYGPILNRPLRQWLKYVEIRSKRAWKLARKLATTATNYEMNTANTLAIVVEYTEQCETLNS